MGIIEKPTVIKIAKAVLIHFTKDVYFECSHPNDWNAD